MSRTGRVTNVPVTSLLSGAKIADLITLPVPVFIAFKLLRSMWKHWYVSLSIAVALLIDPLIIPFSLGLTWIFLVWIFVSHQPSTARRPRTLLRGAYRIAQAHRAWRLTSYAGKLHNGPRLASLFSLRRIPVISSSTGNAITFDLDFSRIGHTVRDLEDRKENVVAALGAQRCRIKRRSPSRCYLTVEWNTNILNSQISPVSSLINPSQLRPISLDQTENDAILYLDTSLLVVGESGSGKSNLTWHILDQLNQTNTPYKLHVVDPKRIELYDLENGANTLDYVGRAADAENLVVEFQKQMNNRLEQLKFEGKRKVDISKKYPLHILILDELLLLSRVFKGGSVDTPLADILAVGRAAGFVVIASSQLGQKDALGPIRDLFPQRVCMATKSSDLTNSVLGPNAEQRGARCSEITVKGEGYIYTDFSDDFVRFRCPLITDTPGIANYGDSYTKTYNK
jgi:GTPase SAR1 family protein